MKLRENRTPMDALRTLIADQYREIRHSPTVPPGTTYMPTNRDIQCVLLGMEDVNSMGESAARPDNDLSTVTLKEIEDRIIVAIKMLEGLRSTIPRTFTD